MGDVIELKESVRKDRTIKELRATLQSTQERVRVLEELAREVITWMAMGDELGKMPVEDLMDKMKAQADKMTSLARAALSEERKD